MATLQKHPFHLVDPSPWPFLSSFAVLTTTISLVQVCVETVSSEARVASSGSHLRPDDMSAHFVWSVRP